MTWADTSSVSRLAVAAVARGAGFVALWIVVAGAKPADLVMGIVAAACATAASLFLILPRGGGLRLWPLTLLVGRFLWQSVAAGIDVARRALDPRLPLKPGFIVYVTGLPSGTARETFTALMSLLPGTLPAGADTEGRLIIHCLDTAQPVASQLASEEASLTRVLRRRRDYG
jgi:multicomponent Na+:H+ antiporter subunit E